MAVIEIRTFRLADDADDAAFLAADSCAQVEFAYRQRGLLRRTTARGPDGTWLVLTVWADGDAADAAAAAAVGDDAAQAAASLADRASVAVRRFTTLD